MIFQPTKYQLKNPWTGHLFEDQGWTLCDSQSQEPALIQAVYKHQTFQPREDLPGIYRYANWLPIKRILQHSCAPVTYRSEGLAKILNLSHLYITFSGWHPSIGAMFRTGSFKETEAYSVLARLDEHEERILVVQSAGNTARAFAQVCSDNHIPIVICIPEDNLSDLWFRQPLESCVKVIATPHGSDYYDAIALGNKLATNSRYLLEGGATNIARRDGMGTTILSCAEQMGRIPDAYFQAVGSGTGAIAAWENACRLEADGLYGKNNMRVYVAQNSPFTLLYDAWKAHSRALPVLEESAGRSQAQTIIAKVLSNRKPPYSIHGGLFDTLLSSYGDAFVVSNDELLRWQQIFLEKEGILLHPAACVAVASLAQAVAAGTVQSHEYIMLNCTGGGIDKAQEEGCYYKTADKIIGAETKASDVVAMVESLW